MKRRDEDYRVEWEQCGRWLGMYCEAWINSRPCGRTGAVIQDAEQIPVCSFYYSRPTPRFVSVQFSRHIFNAVLFAGEHPNNHSCSLSRPVNVINVSSRFLNVHHTTYDPWFGSVAYIGDSTRTSQED